MFFCSSDETVDHLFVSCQLARQIWRLIHFTFNITPPTSVTNLFGNWLYGVGKDTKASIRIGMCAFLWVIWNCRNDVVFNNAKAGQFFQVIHRARCGRTFFQATSEEVWLLDVHG